MGLVVCAGVLLWACTDHDDDNKTAAHGDAGSNLESSVARYVGALNDSDVRVAVVSDDANARVFFCGGDSSYATATHWFKLTFDGSELNTDDGAWHLRAKREADGISGEITHDPDAQQSFTASPVSKDTIAGLYEGKADCGRMGLIITQPDHDQASQAQGACVGDNHDPEQVNPILPIELTAGKVQVSSSSSGAKVALAPAGLTPL